MEFWWGQLKGSEGNRAAIRRILSCEDSMWMELASNRVQWQVAALRVLPQVTT